MKQRSVVLDVAKGMLVLAMLIHHAWTAIYMGGSDSLRGVVSFVSSAFILYSGFLIGYFLLKGYILEPLSRFKRDLFRGLRLMLIFLSFNVLLYFVGYRGISQHVSFIVWLFQCLSPNPNEAAVFALLNSFAYFFASSAVVLYFCSRLLSGGGEFVIRACVVLTLVLVIALLSLHEGFGAISVISSTIIYGFYGIVAGVSVRYVSTRYLYILNFIGNLSVIIYIVLSVMTFLGSFKPYAYYGSFVFLASVAIWKISDFFVARNVDGITVTWIAWLGNYTLLAYMTQVVVSQLMNLGMINLYHYVAGVWSAFVLALLVMSLVMIAVVWGVDFLRRKNKSINYAYVLIFG